MNEKPAASLMPAIYSHHLAEVQSIARRNGYAIAVHGSMKRDLDLVAVPWHELAVEPESLIKSICRHMGVQPLPGDPGQKPHGRMAYTLLMGADWFMDLSVMPRSARVSP